MDALELKERLWAARVEAERTDGAAGLPRPTTIVLEPSDWSDVKATAARFGWAGLGAETFIGIPVTTDPQRPRGTVALAWIKEV